MNESSHPQPYSDRERLRAQIGDARALLASGDVKIIQGAAGYAGSLEAILKMVCDSAEHVLDEAGPAVDGGWFLRGDTL